MDERCEKQLFMVLFSFLLFFGFIFTSFKYRLSPSVLREATYSTLRMGGYDVMKTYLNATDPSNLPYPASPFLPLFPFSSRFFHSLMFH